MNTLKSFLSLILLLASGCASTATSNRTLELQSAFLSLKKKHPVAVSSTRNDYLATVAHRLSDSLPEDARKLVPEIIIVKTKEPLAVAGPTGEILLSTRFLNTIQTESELLFVLSHELAHSALNHAQEAAYLSPEAELEFRHKAELEADAYAVSVMVVAGYDPRHATNALAFVYRLQGIEPDVNTHPEFAERVYAIQSAITDSGWIPPGIATSRSFKIFKQQLS
jgi:predicted Zn-dependent protease